MNDVKIKIIIGRDNLCKILGSGGIPISKTTFYKLVAAGLPVKREKNTWIGNEDAINEWSYKLVMKKDT